MLDPLPRGQERTYRYRDGEIPIRCEEQAIGVIATMAELTRLTVLDIPGARETAIPEPVLAVMNDILELRQIAQEKPWNAQAWRDVVEADLERHIASCLREANRRILFGAYEAPHMRTLGNDPCGFGGADVRGSGAAQRLDPRPDSWIALVVVPPQIRRCTLIRPLERC
jgi:hypothetical protein